MMRIYRLVLASALAGACLLIAAGCTCNPVSSQPVAPPDPLQDESVVTDYQYDEGTGGYPATPTTTIDKYDSDQGVLYIGTGP